MMWSIVECFKMQVNTWIDQWKNGENNLDIPLRVWKGWNQGHMTNELK